MDGRATWSKINLFHDGQDLWIPVPWQLPCFLLLPPSLSNQGSNSRSMSKISVLDQKQYVWCYVWSCWYARLLASCSPKACYKQSSARGFSKGVERRADQWLIDTSFLSSDAYFHEMWEKLIISEFLLNASGISQCIQKLLERTDSKVTYSFLT